MIKYKSKIDRITLKKEKSEIRKMKIKMSNDAYKYSLMFYEDDINIYESSFLILLNSANNTIGYAKISQGGVAGTVIDPIIIVKYAIDSLARSVIIVHNHPSGNVNPSDNDKLFTKKLNEALKLFQVSLLDSLVISEQKYYSFADNGLL
jgi:DNA repair protein RadC